MNTIRVIILGCAILAAGLLVGGRFQAIPVSRGDAFGGLYIVDRYLGTARYCLGIDCRSVRQLPPAPPPEAETSRTGQ